MGAKIWFIIVIVIALGVGLYIYSSGALVSGVHDISSLFSVPSGTPLFGGNKTNSSSSSSSSSWSFWSLFAPSGHTPVGPSISAVMGQPGAAPGSGPTGGGSGGGGAAAINPADIPPGYTAAQLSPYFHDVVFGSMSAATLYSYGTITLDDAAYDATGPIDVTGWQIKSNDGDEFVPQAVNLYDPTGLAPASDILLKPGDIVYLYSSSAPFNLRLNECIGYAAHVANFTPPLPETCPYINQSQLQDFSAACQNYLDTLGACQAPDFSSPQIPQTDYACMNYLEDNFTYRSCFNQHSQDPNFLSNQVWVWTGSNPINPSHDTVRLLDKNGLLVDIYTY